MSKIQELIETAEFSGLRDALSNDPALANEAIGISDDPDCAKAHPLHRICDGVFAGKFTDREAVEIATIFLEFGAHVDGYGLTQMHDNPLIAAASLHAEQVGILYVEHGANIHHAGCHGGTALHWAAWCGRDQLVARLVTAHAALDRKCVEFQATPIFWAVHGLKFGGEKNRHHQVECAELLLAAGADPNIPNGEGTSLFDLLDENDMASFEKLNRSLRKTNI